MKTKILISTDDFGMFSIRKLVSILLILSLQFAAMATGTNCTSLKKDGTPCKSWAVKGTTTCYMHSSANKCEGKRKAGAKCGGLKVKGSKYCSNHQNQAK